MAYFIIVQHQEVYQNLIYNCKNLARSGGQLKIICGPHETHRLEASHILDSRQ